MCDGLTSKCVNGFIYLQNTNSQIKDGKLIWSKLPKWFYLGVAVSAITITVSVLLYLRIFPSSNPFTKATYFALFGGGLLVANIVLAVKRYRRFRACEKIIATQLLKIVEVIKPPIVEISDQVSFPNHQALPKDVALHIFSFLPLNALCKISKVNKIWYILSRNNELWDYFGGLTFKNWQKKKTENPSKDFKAVYASNLLLKHAKKEVVRTIMGTYKSDHMLP